MIITQTLRGVGVGVAAGAIAALGASRVLAPYLFGVTTHDPATYASIFGFLGIVSLASSWLPAQRAGRVEPAIVLRGD
jgi:ABC-type lipoprotein release transport system permease subunit